MYEDVTVCDRWVVMRIEGDTPHYRLLIGNYGGYLYGDSWRINSGITKAKKRGNYFLFYGHSGSCYSCHKDKYGLNTTLSFIWEQINKAYEGKVSLLGEDIDWLSVSWL